MKFNRGEAEPIKFLVLIEGVPCPPPALLMKRQVLPNSKARLVQVLCCSLTTEGAKGDQALHMLSQESAFQEIPLPCLVCINGNYKGFFLLQKGCHKKKCVRRHTEVVPVEVSNLSSSGLLLWLLISSDFVCHVLPVRRTLVLSV